MYFFEPIPFDTSSPSLSVSQFIWFTIILVFDITIFEKHVKKLLLIGISLHQC